MGHWLNMQAKLSTKGLTKKYGAVVALEPTDIEVKKGELLTLLGPSGSGKTTLLQMVAGLVQPSGGKILYDGKDGTHLPPGKRGIGMVFQSYALFPHMSVKDNVAYPMRMRKTLAGEIDREVDRALAMVQMQHLAQRMPRELSGGQQQRVALARCFVYRPEIILLDEPLGALDKNLREHMQMEIRRLHRELGGTFIYVTHDQDEALTLSDRICLMNEARVEQIGTPAEMYHTPKSRFAASFLGHSNLLTGNVHVDANGSPSLAWAGSCLPLPPGGATAHSATLMVRPESISLVSPESGFLRGRITEVVFHGSDLKVLVDIQGGQNIVVRAPSESPAARLNDTVGVRWSPARSVLLTQ